MASLNRRVWLRTLILAFMLIWPMLLFARPAHISDSLAYLKGGNVAVNFLADKISHTEPDFPSTKTSGQDFASESYKELENVNGARSASYSSLSYMLRGFDHQLIPLALFQSFIAALVIVLATETFGPLSNKAIAAVALVLALATPLPFVTNLTIPDIFAALQVLAMVVLLIGFDRLSVMVRIILSGVIAFAVSSHASVPPVALGIIFLGTLRYLFLRNEVSRIEPRALGLALVAVLVGVTLTMASGLIAFGEVSVAPKRFPLTLARSISDGPARWYLNEECRRPRYAVCEIFGTQIPANVNDFLFQNGLEERATPEQMDRIRAEEREIVVRAAMRYPAIEFGNLSGNIVRQLYSFENRIAHFDSEIAISREGLPFLKQVDADRSFHFKIFDWIAIISVAISLLWLALKYRNLEKQDRDALFLSVGAICGNAFVVVVFSGIMSRYQTRMIWLIPLFACIFALAERYRSQVNQRHNLPSPWQTPSPEK